MTSIKVAHRVHKKRAFLFFFLREGWGRGLACAREVKTSEDGMKAAIVSPAKIPDSSFVYARGRLSMDGSVRLEAAGGGDLI